MPREITIELRDPYAEMLEELEGAGLQNPNGEFRRIVEQAIHESYQQATDA